MSKWVLAIISLHAQLRENPQDKIKKPNNVIFDVIRVRKECPPDWRGTMSRYINGRTVLGLRMIIPGFVLLLTVCQSLSAGHTDNLAEIGRRIFFQESFDGNGRTCGTCHRAERNFSIDPVFIATLPDDDPLFVAEFNPELEKDFENPRLMREFGLILENQDGFDDLENNFNMRGVPHLLGMQVSIDSVAGPRTGWSGDGAPDTCPATVQASAPDRCDDFDGTLRAFTLGAVIQHFPKTLGRILGMDFRLPTDFELDALEAFQLSLGRQEDLKLPLPLRGTVARHGQEVFLDDTVGKCNLCHKNAGANAEFSPGAGLGNFNFNTGVENLIEKPADLTGELVPPDDGFGTPGGGAFNTPPLVEAADTGAFFHNNAIETIEGAVAFYNGDEFNQSPAGALSGGIKLSPTQVVAVAAFLRVINAIENIDSSIHLLEENVPKDIRLSIYEMEDAVRVLEGGGLHPKAILNLKNAVRLAKTALVRRPVPRRHRFVQRSIRQLEAARSDLVKSPD